MKEIKEHYDFVSFGEVRRENLDTESLHGRFGDDKLSGIIECNLIARSDLCIKSIFDGQEIFIPGSSLKGMIRAIMEALYGGCGFGIERDYNYEDKKKNIKRNVQNCYFPDKKYADGSSKELSSYADCAKLIEKAYQKDQNIMDVKLCPICSLFGLAAGSVVSFRGRLSFDDSLKVSVKLKKVSLPRSEQPKAYSLSRYFSDRDKWDEKAGDKTGWETKQYKGGEYKGRKFYLQGANDGKKTQTVRAVIQGTKFSFTIHFANISEYEMGMLLFALTLDGKICHRMGYGKPFGLGKADVKPENIRLINKSAYEDFGGDNQLKADLVSIDRRIAAFKKQYLVNFGKEITQTSQFKELQEIQRK